MARPRAALPQDVNEFAIHLIEKGLSEQKTVKEILAGMRQDPAFTGYGAGRLLRQWTRVWRPMVAAGGRVALPRRGGGRGARSSGDANVRAGKPSGDGRSAKRQTRPESAAARPEGQEMHRMALEQMMDLVCAMLADAPDSAARDASLRAFPSFVRAVRSVTRNG